MRINLQNYAAILFVHREKLFSGKTLGQKKRNNNVRVNSEKINP
jgi:hypothetical protein